MGYLKEYTVTHESLDAKRYRVLRRLLATGDDICVSGWIIEEYELDVILDEYIDEGFLLNIDS